MKNEVLESKGTSGGGESRVGPFVFRYAGPDTRVSYSVTPRPSGLGDVRAEVGGESACTPLADAAVRFVSPVESRSTLAAVRLEGDVLHATQIHRLGGRSATVELRYRILGKSLIVDVACRGGEATELDLGAFAGVERPEAIPLPYANYGGQSHCLLMRGAGSPLFASVWIDWYRSNASELFATTGIVKKKARINGGVRYRSKTDGERNDLFERVFLTVSPIFEEVLPTIANPPSSRGRAAGEYLWQESWGPADFEKEHERSRRLRAYGIEKLIQCNHEIAWRDNADSFTLRIHAAPKKGGDEALRRYVKRQKSLGWRSGLYSNYTDFAPVNENWDENAVQLESDRDWRRAWPRCYALKPSRAVELDARYAPMIKKKYDPDAAYTDVHTAVAPWGYCDYDARVPGAGTFAATFYAYGELLLADSKVYGGPIFSEGTYQCLYAGLPDGNYALHYGGYDFARDPLLPQFDLHKIHPLSTDIGMGWTANFCKWPGWNLKENISTSIDRFIMTTMAYGHLGWLVEEGHGIDLTCRSYYALQQLTRRYAMVEPRSIRYFDGQRLLSSSEALASGAHRDSQLKIVYENGLEVWVNGSWSKPWRLPESAGAHVLPPTGWFAREPGEGFFTISAQRGGRRYDHVRSPEYLYADGRGELLLLEHLACRGGGAIRSPRPDGLEIIDIGGNDEIGFGGGDVPEGLSPDHVLTRIKRFAEARSGVAEAYDAEGRSLGPAELRWVGGTCWLLPVEKGIRYDLRRGDAARPSPGRELLIVSSVKREVAAGETVTAVVRADSDSIAPESLAASSGDTKLDLNVRRADRERNRTLLAQFLVPHDARPGEALWVRFEAKDATRRDDTVGAWLLLVVRTLAEVRFAPGTVELRGGESRTSLTGRLGIGDRPATIAFGPPDWLNVTPRSFAAYGDFEREIVLRAEEPRAGRLLATVTSVDVRQVLTFDLRPGQAVPGVLRFHGGGVKFSWGHCLRGAKERPGDAATGASFHERKSIVCGGIERPGLFSHPPYTAGVGYTFADFESVDLPDLPCNLHVYIGLEDGGDPSDGVEFVVEALVDDGSKVEILRENTSRSEWREVTADLGALRGKRVRFRFVADVGPANNSTADWAAWGEPAVRLKTPVPTLTLDERGR